MFTTRLLPILTALLLCHAHKQVLPEALTHFSTSYFTFTTDGLPSLSRFTIFSNSSSTRHSPSSTPTNSSYTSLSSTETSSEGSIVSSVFTDRTSMSSSSAPTASLSTDLSTVSSSTTLSTSYKEGHSLTSSDALIISSSSTSTPAPASSTTSTSFDATSTVTSSVPIPTTKASAEISSTYNSGKSGSSMQESSATSDSVSTSGDHSTAADLTPTLSASTSAITSSGDAVFSTSSHGAEGSSSILPGIVTTSSSALGTATLDSSATEALISARALQTSIDALIEQLRGREQEQETEDELDTLLAWVWGFFAKLRPKPGDDDDDDDDDATCLSHNIITALFRATRCIADTLQAIKARIHVVGVDLSSELDGLSKLINGGHPTLPGYPPLPDNPAPSLTLPSASTPTGLSSSTSSSSCSQATATACSALCDGSGQCSTTCTSTYTGCSVTNTFAASTVEYAYGALMTGTPDDDMSAIETHSPQEARLIYDGAYVISHVNITLVTCAQPFYPQGNPDFWMTRESLQMARDAFCSWMSNHKDANRGGIEYPWSARVEDPIVIRRSELLGSDCDENTPQGAWSEDLCKSTIDRIIDGCHTSDNGFHHWKAGGYYNDACVHLGIERGTWDGSHDSWAAMKRLGDKYRPRALCGHDTECTVDACRAGFIGKARCLNDVTTDLSRCYCCSGSEEGKECVIDVEA